MSGARDARVGTTAGRSPQHAVLLAGGRGERLGAITRRVPKPLLPVQGVPAIVRLIAALREAGVATCTVVTCHRADLIEGSLGDGRDLGVRIEYLREHEPLGTAGCLGLLADPADSFYLVNADVVTDLCFRSLAEQHDQAGAAATVAVWRQVTASEYGVVEIDHRGRLVAYREKPVQENFVAMGIACLAPRVCRVVRPDEATSMPDVLARLLAAGESVVCHRHEGIWADIGRPEDFDRCQRLVLPSAPVFLKRRAA